MEISQGYTPLDEIVRFCLFQSNETGTNKYLVALSHAQDCVRELHSDAANEIKTVELQINESPPLTVDWPEDYMGYTKLGLCIDGNIFTLGLNPDLCLHPTFDDCGNDLGLQGTGDPQGVLSDSNSNVNGTNAWPGYYFFNFHPRNGEHMGKIYGNGGGWSRRGYYRLDKRNRRFALSSEVVSQGNTTLILEYYTSGMRPGEKTFVPAIAIETIKAWIKWWMAENHRGSTESKIARLKKNYYQNLRKFRQRANPWLLHELVAASRRGYKATPKN